jgi:hypothetical protein
MKHKLILILCAIADFRLSLPVYEHRTNTVVRALQMANLDEPEVGAILALLYTTYCKA